MCEKNATDLSPTAYQMATSHLPHPRIGELQFWLLQSLPPPESNLLMENLYSLCGLQIWHPNPRPKNCQEESSHGELCRNFSSIPEGYRLVRSCPEFDLQVPIVDKFLLKIGSERSTALPCSYTQDSELNTIVDSFIFSKAH